MISVLLDIYDGAVARICKKTSKFGGELDLFMDVVQHVLIYYYFIMLYFSNVKHKITVVIILTLIIYGVSKYVLVLDHKHKAKNFEFLYELGSHNTILKSLIEYYLLQRKL